MVRPDSHRIPRVPWYLGTPSGGRSPFAYRAVTFCGRPFQARSTRRRLCNSSPLRQQKQRGPTTPHRKRLPAITPVRFRLAPFRSPLLRGCCLFLRVLRCFSSPRALYPAYVFNREYLETNPDGLPHSEIPGSILASSSPGLFAATLRPSSALGAKASTVCP